jgi:putative ABC transport system substrate-binding protein
MKRRAFIGLIGGTAATWSFAARAQPTMRRVAVLMAPRESDEGRAWLNAFVQAFQKLGWTEGRNVSIEIRWAGGNAERARDIAAEFVALNPDVVVANGTPGMAAMKQATAVIPVVFVVVTEPVAQGFIASVARPGGNVTGFTMIDFSLIGKQVQLLKTISPATERVGLLFNPEAFPHYEVYLRAFQAEARRPVEVARVAVRSPTEIDVAVTEFAASPGGGVAVLPDGGFTISNRAAIRAALERHRLPYLVPWRSFVSEGALISYGPDQADIFRCSADYVDRILKGANPAELPAQAPNKFELAINLKTAKALSLEIPPSLLATADEVIE